MARCRRSRRQRRRRRESGGLRSRRRNARDRCGVSSTHCVAACSVRVARVLPDWSGLWGHGSPLPDEWRRNPPPLKPEVAAAQAAGAAGATDGDAVLLRYCRPLQFTGSSGGFTEAVEFLFTPGRVTLTNEMGLIRRIIRMVERCPRLPTPPIPATRSATGRADARRRDRRHQPGRAVPQHAARCPADRRPTCGSASAFS